MIPKIIFEKSIEKFFECKNSNYDELYLAKITSNDNGISIISTIIENSKSPYIYCDDVKRCYEGFEDEDVYSPGIHICLYHEELRVGWSFVFSMRTGEGYLISNNSICGYNKMIDLLFGSDNNFKSTWTVKESINSNVSEIRPFLSLGGTVIDSIFEREQIKRDAWQHLTSSALTE